MSTDQEPIIALLNRWSQGDAEAFPRLMALAYEDLRAIAQRRLMGAGGGSTLATTAVVHETYLRLAVARSEGPADILRVPDAVDHLAERHPAWRRARHSVRTVEREWTRAKAYRLERLLADDDPG